ncbi:MAG TPA: hypothetical protein VFS92_02250 [Planctomycetota bacterium]|nr:hypothetical protein [Planctomycetota bacterium]
MTDSVHSRLKRLRLRCLIAGLAFSAILSITTFDFRPLLPDESRVDWTMYVLGAYVYFIWPVSLLGLAGSIVLYVATMIRPDSIVARWMPERSSADATNTP